MTYLRPRARTLTLALALLLALALTAASAPLAAASSSQESMFQDDSMLVFGDAPSRIASTLDTLAGLGVQRIRVSVFWADIAPDPHSATPPSFDAADPNAYPAGNWTRYDQLVRLAQSRSIGVDFDVTSPAPLWATDSRSPLDLKSNFNPNAQAYGLFLEALGRRYSGTFVPPSSAAPTPVTPPQQTQNGGLLGILGPSPSAQAPASRTSSDPNDQIAANNGTPLPRVNYWSLWNEPNQPGWLLPQWSSYHGRQVERGASIYRVLVDNGVRGLDSSGHGHDTILIGETAPKGAPDRRAVSALTPLRFIRRLYCLGDKLRPLSGSAAAAAGCPLQNIRSVFPRLHPALFTTTGFADHPYSLLFAPSVVDIDPDWAAIGELGRLTHTLDRAFSAYGSRRRVPIFLTEYGYQTNPPDPYSGLPLSAQAAYIDQADYIASRNSRVATLSQFLLRDDRPLAGAAPGTPAYWSTFQTGLEYADGSPKPSLIAYRLPVWIPQPTVKLGHKMLVWGQLRLAPHNVAQAAQIQFAPNGSGSFSPIATRTTANPEGFFTARVGLPGSGQLRVAWTDSSGNSDYSRTVNVTVVR